MLTPPKQGEYGEYYQTYIDRVKDKDIRSLLLSQIGELEGIYRQLTEEKAAVPYKEGKWTYKELLGHLNDTEKIMFFRALCIARGEKASLPGFDQDTYVRHADFNTVPNHDLLVDFRLGREQIVSFIKTAPQKRINVVGLVNGQPMSVTALLHIIVGHFAHHLEIIKILPR